MKRIYKDNKLITRLIVEKTGDNGVATIWDIIVFDEKGEMLGCHACIPGDDIEVFEASELAKISDELTLA